MKMPDKKPELEQDPEKVVPEKKEEVDSSSLIENANAAAKRLEEANARMEVLVKKQEAMQIERKLSGSTDAGIPQKTNDEKSEAAAKEFLKGTGLEEDLFPSKK